MEKARLEKLVAADMTIRAIAEDLGCSPTTVRYWLRLHGLRTTAAAQRPEVMGQSASERVRGRCVRHGEVDLVRRAEGGHRCVKCRSEAVAEARRRAKALLVAEAGGSCTLCGYDRCVGALQFHHLNPATKNFDLGSRGLARSMERLREETAKCVLLCANCHAEVENGVTALVAPDRSEAV